MLAPDSSSPLVVYGWLSAPECTVCTVSMTTQTLTPTVTLTVTLIVPLTLTLNGIFLIRRKSTELYRSWGCVIHKYTSYARPQAGNGRLDYTLSFSGIVKKPS